MSKFRTPFGPQIAEHWRQNFPKEAEALEKAGLLESSADAAAERDAAVLSQGLEKGLQYNQAAELANLEWGSPPTLSQSTSRREPET